MGGHKYKAVLGKYFNTLMTSIEITVTIWCKGNSYIRQTGKSSPILYSTTAGYDNILHIIEQTGNKQGHSAIKLKFIFNKVIP